MSKKRIAITANFSLEQLVDLCEFLYGFTYIEDAQPNNVKSSMRVLLNECKAGLIERFGKEHYAQLEKRMELSIIAALACRTDTSGLN